MRTINRLSAGMACLFLLVGIVSACQGGANTGLDYEATAQAEAATMIVETMAAQPSPTDTPLPPTATPIPTKTPTPLPPTVTPSPTEALMVAKDTLCLTGPTHDHAVVSAVLTGTPVTPIAYSEVPGWVAIDHPLITGLTCWLEIDTLSIPFDPEAAGLPFVKAPPRPSPQPHPTFQCNEDATPRPAPLANPVTPGAPVVHIPPCPVD